MNTQKLENAIRAGNEKETARLLAHEPGLANTPLKDALPPLVLAARYDRPGVATALLDAGADVEATDSEGNTALAVAAEAGCSGVAQLLLARGVDINHANDRGFRPLDQAAVGEDDGHVEILGLLLEAGADIHYATNGGSTPLSSACMSGRLENVTQLVQAGADVNECVNGKTALQEAIGCDHEKIVDYLLCQGADPSIRTAPHDDPANADALELAEALQAKRSLRVLRRHLGLDAKPTAPAQLTWEQFVARLPDRGRAYGLRKPAPPEAVTNLEEAIGGMLPEEFRDYLFTNNGQKEAAEPLVPPWLEFDVAYRLLGAREILGQWKMMHRVKAGGDFDDGRPSPDKGIRRTWWDEGWVPFADNGSGDYVCLDLHPAKEGKRGQVVHFSHESGRRLLLAKSFAAWLAAVAQDLAG
ncbi:MAG TPA: ankyrin repeat domain-containing protein [Gemmataceae bacterium]|nr:ankyrin repeat domain-containing protein [Gemmataceae bacterium]